MDQFFNVIKLELVYVLGVEYTKYICKNKELLEFI
jgi:hypothetical protein